MKEKPSSNINILMSANFCCIKNENLVTYKFRQVYFVKEYSYSKHKYSEDDIIKMLEFVVDNIVVVFIG